MSPSSLFFTLLLIYIHCTMHVSLPFLREFSKARETRPLGCTTAFPSLRVFPLLPSFSPILSPSSLTRLIFVFFFSTPEVACGIPLSLSLPPQFFCNIYHTTFSSSSPLSFLLLLSPWVLPCPTSNLSHCYSCYVFPTIIHNPCTQACTPSRLHTNSIEQY